MNTASPNAAPAALAQTPAAAAAATATATAPSASTATAGPTILVVEDTPFWQKQIEQALRAGGFAPVMAGNGAEALALLESTCAPRLIISDIEMPQMNGLALLKAVRERPQWQRLPFILLTTGAAKEFVLEATRLRAAEYLLKGSFSAAQLVERAKKWLEQTKPPAPAAVAAPSRNAPRPANAAPAAPAGPPAPKASAFPRLLQRTEALNGIAAQITAGKTLAGVSALIEQLCPTPQSDANASLEVVKNDPMFAMRVMQQANASKRVGTVEEAVRAIGAEAVRKIAKALPAYPQSSKRALQLWQHSVAVGSVMHRIVPRSFEMGAGVAYLIGLLHDLPEILLTQAFPGQYEAALDFADQAHRPLRQIMPDVLSVSMSEIANEVVSQIKLPPLIATPFREFAAANLEPGRSGAMGDRLAMALRFSEYYANALQLTWAPSEAMFAPLTQAECRAAYIAASPLSGIDIRAHALATSKKLAGMPAEESAVAVTGGARRPRLWYARLSSFASLDTVEEALKLMADVELHAEPPSKREHFAGVDGVVVCAPAADTFGVLWYLADRTGQDASGNNRVRVLNILPPASADAPGRVKEVHPSLHYPFTLKAFESAIAMFK
jgi:CheY-like chemotaxis protein